MRTPRGGLWPALIALLAAVVFVLAASVPAGAVHKPVCSAARQAYPLHGGTKTQLASCGQPVKDAQWLLAGHKPSIFTKTKPTFHGKPNGLDGAKTKAAVKAMKYRIGYPAKGQCPTTRKATTVTDTAGKQFIEILEGKQHRPLCWMKLASDRIKGTVVVGATQVALEIKSTELGFLGVHEIPSGSNRGPCISVLCEWPIDSAHIWAPFQVSTGAYGLAWCASFADYILKITVGQGFGSSNDAYVPTIVEYAQARGWLQAKPRLGSFVVFLNDAGRLASAYHIGFVIKLVGGSAIQTIEGNAGDAYGGSVKEVLRPFASYHMVYIDYPGVA
jgi:hypothetical protein